MTSFAFTQRNPERNRSLSSQAKLNSYFLSKLLAATGSWVLTSLAEVVQTLRVDGEEADRGTVLGTHVGDGGAVCDRQLRDARSEKLDELAHDTHAAQVLK